MISGQLRKIKFEDALEFRIANLHQDLWTDKWDQVSLHYGYFVSDDLAGIIRIAPSQAGRLPSSDFIKGVTFEEDDVEFSRLAVDQKYRRKGLTFGFFMDLFSLLLCDEISFGKVYINVREKGAVNIDTYKGMGFSETGFRHMDPLYNCLSTLLFVTSKELLKAFPYRNNVEIVIPQ